MVSREGLWHLGRWHLGIEVVDAEFSNVPICKFVGVVALGVDFLDDDVACVEIYQ